MFLYSLLACCSNDNGNRARVYTLRVNLCVSGYTINYNVHMSGAILGQKERKLIHFNIFHASLSDCIFIFVCAMPLPTPIRHNILPYRLSIIYVLISLDFNIIIFFFNFE